MNERIDRVLLEARYADDPLVLALIDHACDLEQGYQDSVREFKELEAGLESWRTRYLQMKTTAEQLREENRQTRQAYQRLKDEMNGTLTAESEPPFTVQMQYDQASYEQLRRQLSDFQGTLKTMGVVKKAPRAPFGKKKP
jgi:chromosome segregation ATPase